MNLSEETYLYILGAITAGVTWTAKLLVKIFRRKEKELKELREENTDLKVSHASLEAYATKKMAKSKKRTK